MRSRKIQRVQVYAIRSIAILVLGSLTFFLGRGALKMYDRYRQAASARMGAQVEVESLEKRKSDLENHIKRLSSERGMEEEYRRRFGVAEPGEGVIEIVAPTSSVPTDAKRGGIIEWFKRLF